MKTDLHRLMDSMPTRTWRFLKEHGSEFIVSDLIDCLFEMEPRQCYSNCQQMMNYSDLYYYCEGYAISRHMPLPIHHAWLVPKNSADDGELYVIDPTWGRDCEEHIGTYYFGCVFPTDYVNHIVKSEPDMTCITDRYYGKFRWSLEAGEHNYMASNAQVKIETPNQDFYLSQKKMIRANKI